MMAVKRPWFQVSNLIIWFQGEKQICTEPNRFNSIGGRIQVRGREAQSIAIAIHFDMLNLKSC